MGRWSILLLLAWSACSASAGGDHEVVRTGPLLDRRGQLREPGWARRQLLAWNPAVLAPDAALRQWDFVALQDEANAVNITLFDLGFVQLGSVSLIDLATSEKRESSTVRLSQSDAFELSAALDGDARFQLDGALRPALAMKTTRDATTTTLTVEIAIDTPLSGPPATASLQATRPGAMEYLSLATPFADEPQQFFFEQKVPGLRASGTVTVGDRTATFVDAPAVIDWGRGVWPDAVTWRWAAASGVVDGKTIALNLGEGFGDDRHGTENMVVVDGKLHKLGRVGWQFDAAVRTTPWQFVDGAGQVSLQLQPAGEETGGLDFGDRYSRLSKIYGVWSGTITLEDGTALALDGLRGFAEQMQLAW